MERNGDAPKKNDAEILARLRRRSAAPPPSDDFWFEGPDFAASKPDAPPTPTDAASRSEALRRLVAKGAPKEPMSALSPTLRNLREELNTGDAASFATVYDEKNDFAADATLDLLESTLEANGTNGDASTDAPILEETASNAFDGRSEKNEEDDNTESAEERDENVGAERDGSAENVENEEFRENAGVENAENVDSEATVEPSNAVDPEKAAIYAKAEALAKTVKPMKSAKRERRVELVASENAPIASSAGAAASVADLMVVSNVKKGYVKAKKLIPVLQGVDLTAKQGELLAIVGQSGSGKSTLLHLMGTLDAPDSGTIHFDGQRIDNLSSAQRDVLRNHFIGMIFQFYHLIPEMTTLENVLAPLMIRESIFGYWRNHRKYVERAKELLALVGLSHRLRHRPNELSGGEMQRASIARALISNPRILLADEPTGNLDSKASAGVLKLLRRLNEEQNLTIVMVTHDMSQAADADRAIRLVDGLVVPEEDRT